MEQSLILSSKQQLSRCLPNFLGMLFQCQKNLPAKISSHQPSFFCSVYISLTYKCEKCSLFECFANAISLRLNKILFASFKNFITLVACHIICAN